MLHLQQLLEEGGSCLFLFPRKTFRPLLNNYQILQIALCNTERSVRVSDVLIWGARPCRESWASYRQGHWIELPNGFICDIKSGAAMWPFRGAGERRGVFCNPSSQLNPFLPSYRARPSFLLQILMHTYLKEPPLEADAGRYWILILLEFNTAYESIKHAALFDCL